MLEERRRCELDRAEPKAKSRYVPPELWNHTLSVFTEERMVFEARRDGDGWRQNEILKRHLGS
jgi:hypothetical protein